MKSLSIRNIAGQVKMKGKIQKSLSCGCCELINLKHKYEKNRHMREIRFCGIEDI